MTPLEIEHFAATRRHPRNDFFANPNQYRVKFQSFKNCPPEISIQSVDLTRDAAAYLRAWDQGFNSVLPRSGHRERKQIEDRSEEDLERSRRRAKKQVRLLVNELFPNHFTTFTTREDGSQPYFTPEDWKVIWAHFLRLVRIAGIDFQYVSVLERHPSNPRHLHLHVAWRGKAHYSLLRRFWHMAICAFKGQRVSKILRGDDAPGNIQDRPVKASGGYKQARKIAKYISKYITKDLISEFNKKRYWASRGISVEAAKVFWLDSLSMPDAIREAFKMVCEWDYENDVPAQHFFNPSDRILWCAISPDRTPPPF